MTTLKLLADQMESLIDQYGLYNLLDAIEVTCYEKAEHLQVNWQDTEESSRWVRCASAIATAMNKVAEENLNHPNGPRQGETWAQWYKRQPYNQENE